MFTPYAEMSWGGGGEAQQITSGPTILLWHLIGKKLLLVLILPQGFYKMGQEVNSGIDELSISEASQMESISKHHAS